MVNNPFKKVASASDKKLFRKRAGFDGFAPDIIMGANKNDISEVRAALRINWRDINKQHELTSKMTALHHAAAKGNYSMVSFLLEQKGLDINLKDVWGRDALDVAIIVGHQPIIDKMFLFRRRHEEHSTNESADVEPKK